MAIYPHLSRYVCGGKVKEKESEKKSRGVSRKDFVRLAGTGAAVVAGSVLVKPLVAQTASASAKSTIPAKWDFETDVVVVGFGGAGGAAAIEASDGGAKVIVLDKLPTPGGSTTLCEGVYYGAGTSLQKSEGISDSADEMFKYVVAMGEGRADPALVRVWADKSAETFEWLKKLGSTFYSGVNYIDAIPPQKKLEEDAGWALYFSGAECDPDLEAITPAKPRGHMVRPQAPSFPYPPKHPSAPNPAIGITRGTGYFKPIWEAVKARGIQVMLETRAMALITNPATNEVLGVKAERGGTTIYIKASKAVHIATGGFSMNKEMVKLWCPKAVRAVYTESWTGDGHLMGMAIGAAVVNMDAISAGPTVPAGSILVNNGGRRFVDETLYGNVRGNVASGQRHSLVYAILDEDIRAATKLPTTVSAPTIRELAQKLGADQKAAEKWLGANPTVWKESMDPDVLEATVNFYNESVAMGKDREFGRKQLSSQKHPPTEVVPPPERAMKPIRTPPFHAIRNDMENSFVGTITNGGLRINTKAQVLDVNGKVIPRLYAAGQAMGGVNGANYIGSGNAISAAINFGRIAGQNAAKEDSWK